MLAPAMALAGCGTGIFKPEPAAVIGKPCPPPKKYSTAEQLQAYQELQAIPEPCMVCDMIDNYALMREQCR